MAESKRGLPAAVVAVGVPAAVGVRAANLANEWRKAVFERTLSDESVTTFCRSNHARSRTADWLVDASPEVLWKEDWALAVVPRGGKGWRIWWKSWRKSETARILY